MSPERLKIVCGVDRSVHSRTAARIACALARRLGLGLELVHAVDGRSLPSSRGGIGALRAAMQEQLDMTAAVVRLQTGPAAEVLAGRGARAALLVIGTRGEGAVRQALMGSVTAELVRDPACPVVVVPPAVADPGRPSLPGRGVLCGVQDERDGPVAHAAARLAADLRLGVTLAHVVEPPVVAASAGGAPPVVALRTSEEDGRAALRTLESIARSISVNVPSGIALNVLEGSPGPQLDLLAAAEDCALVAIGACDRGALAGALAGAPSRHLLRHGARPVLVCPRLHARAHVRVGASQLSSTAS